MGQDTHTRKASTQMGLQKCVQLQVLQALQCHLLQCLQEALQSHLQMARVKIPSIGIPAFIK